MNQGSTVAARRWVAQGRVQGVGFRWYIREKAQGAGLRGWVRNLPDGSVEVLALGNPALLDDFEPVIRRGPPGAHVISLTGEDVPHESVDTNSFTIKH